jgi:hypothetical protein
MENIVRLDNLKSGKDIVTAAKKAAKETGLALKVKKSSLYWPPFNNTFSNYQKVYLTDPGSKGNDIATFQIPEPLEMYSSFWFNKSKKCEDVTCNKFLENLGKYLGTTVKLAL